MILSCNNISKSYDGKDLLNLCSFHIEDHEKAAIVGVNGAGKSTLLKIIMHLEKPDNGDISISKDKSIGYLSQYQDDSSDNTILDELLSTKREVIETEKKIRQLELDMKSATDNKLDSLLNTYTRLTHEFEINNGYAYKSEVTGILKGLGFSEDSFSKKVATLSGGEKTRVFLGKLLLSKPDIILLDEPTNHLDLNSISWLETFLINYSGAVIVVAHDRYFLDRIVSKVIEIENTKCSVYMGNYQAYSEKKKLLREDAIKHYYNQQRDIKHQEEVIEKLRSFNREKSIKRAESREKMLNKLQVLDKPLELDYSMKMQFEASVLSGNDVLKVDNLAKAYGERTLFSNLTFEIKRSEKVALIGDNGTGKSTILKILNNVIEPDSGSFKLGSNVQIGYYDQALQVLDDENTLFEEISNTYPDMTGTKIRNMLAAFLFTNDDVFKLIGDLSGGERARVSLAKLMLSKSNLLILDEPTNHLDMLSKEILENAISNYSGTVLYVSHDRYFINTTATKIIELTGNHINIYAGNYNYYLDKKDIVERAYIEANSTTSSVQNGFNSTLSNNDSDSSNKLDWKAAKEEQAKKRKLENDIKRAEDKITNFEEKLATINEQLALKEVYESPSKTLELHNNLVTLQKSLDETYALWEKLISENAN